jgi:hypothetical protein
MQTFCSLVIGNGGIPEQGCEQAGVCKGRRGVKVTNTAKRKKKNGREETLARAKTICEGRRVRGDRRLVNTRYP